MRRAGEPPSTVPAACVTASGAMNERIELPMRLVGRRLVGDVRHHRALGAGVAVGREDADGHGRGKRADAAHHGGEPVVRQRAEVVAGGGVLVGPRRVAERERVVDHAEHVGVLEHQRPPADPVERMAEAPHARAVRVGDGADRARGDVPRRVADAERAPRAQLLHRERAERPGGRREHEPALPRRRLLQGVAEPRLEPGHGERRGERARLREDPRRALRRARRAHAARRPGCRGSPRSAWPARPCRRTRRSPRRSRRSPAGSRRRRRSRSASRRTPARCRCRPRPDRTRGP